MIPLVFVLGIQGRSRLDLLQVTSGTTIPGIVWVSLFLISNVTFFRIVQDSICPQLLQDSLICPRLSLSTSCSTICGIVRLSLVLVYICPHLLEDSLIYPGLSLPTSWSTIGGIIQLSLSLSLSLSFDFSNLLS